MKMKQMLGKMFKKQERKLPVLKYGSVLSQIKQALDNGEHLTGVSGLSKFGSMKLTSRISDLRKRGYPVKDYWNYSDDGKKRWKVYYKG